MLLQKFNTKTTYNICVTIKIPEKNVVAFYRYITWSKINIFNYINLIALIQILNYIATIQK